MRMALDETLAGSRVLVCLGPGGVGKTTSAAALAIAAALTGRRVAVLTVDPAARLKDALSLPERAGEFHRVPLPEGTPGTLDALLLDAKGLFDELVRRLAPSPGLAERVLANPVYRNIAGAFAGSDAYMALEQLLDVVAEDRFDLVVVDTPPASHALELFDAPERILALLNSRALEYLGEPVRILGVATSRLARGLLSAVLAALERLTGLSLLADVSALARDFGVVSPGFRERAQAIHDLLRESTTRYVLLTAPDPHATHDVVAFAAELARARIRCDAVLVNRVLSLDHLVPADADARTPASAGASWPASLSRKLVRCAHDLGEQAEAQRAVIESLRDGMARIGALPPHWLELPALFPAPTSLAGVLALAEALRADGAGSATAA
jgi:anion-transporting  ArsA/GET3 family ATPase